MRALAASAGFFLAKKLQTHTQWNDDNNNHDDDDDDTKQMYVGPHSTGGLCVCACGALDLEWKTLVDINLDLRLSLALLALRARTRERQPAKLLAKHTHAKSQQVQKSR